jgi:hypothetical protein
MFGSHMSLEAVSSGKSLPSLLGVFAVLNRTPDRCAIPDGLWMLLSAMAVKSFRYVNPMPSHGGWSHLNGFVCDF